METKHIKLKDLEKHLIDERVRKAKEEGRECTCSYDKGPLVCEHCDKSYAEMQRIRSQARKKLNKE